MNALVHGACASTSKGAIYSWFKAHPSIFITYHMAAPFPIQTHKGLDQRSPLTSFHIYHILDTNVLDPSNQYWEH
jgi:hypothetical protein